MFARVEPGLLHSMPSVHGEQVPLSARYLPASHTHCVLSAFAVVPSMHLRQNSLLDELDTLPTEHAVQDEE